MSEEERESDTGGHWREWMSSMQGLQAAHRGRCASTR